jgi:formiminoglutamase
MAAATAAEARLVVALGGDASVTPPLVDGACGARIGQTGVVLVGPQLDLRPGRTSASSARWLLELGVPAARLVQVGLGDWTEAPSYHGEAASLGIRTFPADQVLRRGPAAVMADALDLAAGAGGPICVHLDLGVTDQSAAPGCRRALPGGLPPAAVRDLANAAGADPRVGVVSIVEVDPTLDPDGRTVRLAALCLLELAAGLIGRDQQP